MSGSAQPVSWYGYDQGRSENWHFPASSHEQARRSRPPSVFALWENGTSGPGRRPDLQGQAHCGPGHGNPPPNRLVSSDTEAYITMRGRTQTAQSCPEEGPASTRNSRPTSLPTR
jgi:hypothetical protein